MTDVRTGLEIVTLETPSLGDRSYLAIADGWAVAIDPQRDIDRVERVLADSGLRLGAVLETHLHNDYVTGGRALALRNRATYAVPAGPRHQLRGPTGRGRRRAARRTADRARARRARPYRRPHAPTAITVDADVAGAVFTGGSLLLGGAGRTDLMGRDRAEALARAQYRSIRRLGACLPADTAVCPTHGFGSYCSAGMPTGGGATIADQRRSNPAFQLDEDAFVDRLLGSLRPYPRYFAAMATRNAWFPTAANLAPLPEVPLDDVVALATTDRHPRRRRDRDPRRAAPRGLRRRPRRGQPPHRRPGLARDVVRLARADHGRDRPRRVQPGGSLVGAAGAAADRGRRDRRRVHRAGPRPRSLPSRGCRPSRSSAVRRFVTSRRSSAWARTS